MGIKSKYLFELINLLVRSTGTTVQYVELSCDSIFSIVEVTISSYTRGGCSPNIVRNKNVSNDYDGGPCIECNIQVFCICNT